MASRFYYRRRRLYGISLLVSCFLPGCAEVRYYPLCVFGTDSRFRSDADLELKMRDFVQGVAGTDARASLSPNGRVVAIVTTSDQQEALKRAWPRVGCVGETRYDTEYRQYKNCVELLQQAMSNSGYPPLGKWSDALGRNTLYCGQILGSSATTFPSRYSRSQFWTPDACQKGSLRQLTEGLCASVARDARRSCCR